MLVEAHGDQGTCALLGVRDLVRLEVTFGVPGEMQKRRTEHRWTHLERSCDVQIGQDKHLSTPLFRAQSQECSSEVVRHRYRLTEQELLFNEVCSKPRTKGETDNDTCGKTQEDAFNETLGEAPAVPVVVRCS